MTKKKIQLCLLGFLLIGFLLRTVSISYGLPHPGYFSSDEIDVVARTLTLAAGDLKPHHFSKPTFMNVVLLAIYGVIYFFGRLLGLIHGRADFERLFIQNPTVFYLSARLLSVLAGTATILLCYTIGRKGRSAAAGLIAAALMAFCFTSARLSHIAKEDVLMVFLEYAVLLWMLRAKNADKAGQGIIAGILVGLAAATKYNGILAAVFPLLFIIQGEKTAIFRRVLFLLAGILIGIIIGVPFFAIHPVQFVQGVFESAIFRQIKGDARWIGSASYVGPSFFLAMFAREMGWLFLITGLLAIGFYGKGFFKRGGNPLSKEPRAVLLALLLFVILNFLTIVISSHRDYHYGIPMTPALALITASFLSDLLSFHKKGFAALLVAILVLGPCYRIIKWDAETLGTDTRLQALDWMRDHIPAHAVIAFDSAYYFQYHPPVGLTSETVGVLKAEALAQGGSGRYFDLLEKYPAPEPHYRAIFLPMPTWADRLRAADVNAYSLESLREREAQWLVCSSYYFDRILINESVSFKPIREFYERLQREWKPAARFEPVPWRNAGPILLVYELK